MFSVVIPLYNKEHTIINTLSSVLSQTFSEFEVLIVNDGSTDNAIKLINTFTSDSRIKIIDQSNQGVSSARNKGVSYSRYEYICFLDGDDEWLPDYLAKMNEAILLYPKAGMYCCAGYNRNPNGSKSLRIAKKYIGKILEINFYENPHVFLHTSATIVLKSEFNRTQGFPMGMIRNEDFALFFSLALITPVVYCGYPLSIYVGGVLGQATSAAVEKNNNILKNVIDRYNLVFENWLKLSRPNKEYIIFLKYEIRHTFVNYLRKKDFLSLSFFISTLNPQIIKLFLSFEPMMYKNKSLRLVSIIYILLTKIRWRFRNYPIVGQKINSSLLDLNGNGSVTY